MRILLRPLLVSFVRRRWAIHLYRGQTVLSAAMDRIPSVEAGPSRNASGLNASGRPLSRWGLRTAPCWMRDNLQLRWNDRALEGRLLLPSGVAPPHCRPLA